jgi:hypothetical protein
MTPKRLQELIDAYGAEPARWPEAERSDAQAYIAGHPQSREVLAAARALDLTLDAWALPPIAVGLRQHVLSRAPSQPMQWSWRRLWLSGAGLAAACAAGALVGAVVIEPALAVAARDRGETRSLLSDGVRVIGLPVETGVPG